jgi:hypothetical protein
VGRDEEVIREYIRHQEREDRRVDQHTRDTHHPGWRRQAHRQAGCRLGRSHSRQQARHRWHRK